MSEDCNEHYRRRTTIVLELLPNGTSRHSIGYPVKLCNQVSDVKNYNIIYIPVPYDQPIPLDLVEPAKSQTRCDEMVIYAHFNGSTVIRDKLFVFLNNVKKFKNTILFYDIINIIDTKDYYTQLSYKYLSDHDITGVKILNVWLSDDLPETRYTVDDNFDYLIVNTDEYKYKPLDLVCTWWFKYYIKRAFGCGKGRLIQNSGTCFLNASINGIIVSENISRMVIMYMKQAIKDTPSILKNIKMDILSLACPTPKILTQTDYIYRIMYNIFCKNKKIDKPFGQTIGPDLMKHAADKFFSSYDGDHGGYTRITLYKLFFNIGAKFIIRLDTLFGPSYIIPKQYKCPKVKLKSEIQYFSEFLDTLEYATPKHITDADMILYILPEFYGGYDFGLYDIVSEINIIEDTKSIYGKLITKAGLGGSTTGDIFKLEFGVIDCVMTNIQGDQGNHAIVGYICDGYNRIFDSATWVIEMVDWPNLGKKNIYADMKKKLETSWHKKFDSVTRIHVDSAVYINTRKIPKYYAEGICNI